MSYSIATTSGRQFARPSRLSRVEQFVDVYMVETQVNQLTETRLSEGDRLVVQEFKKAVSRKRKGKKEGDWGFDDD
jgi:hypothetical protein